MPRSAPPTPCTTTFGTAQVIVHNSESSMAAAAAHDAAALIEAAQAGRGHARIMVGTGNSQLALISSLTRRGVVDWQRVTVFHMDEYVGIAPNHPASFRNWLRVRVAEKCHPAAVHYMAGDAVTIQAEIQRYSELLAAGPLDVAFVGFGENGHIAFNDPPSADFSDQAVVKVVTLDEACRRQQVGEGHFKDVASVPTRALTVTCSALFAARAWICCVPERRKAAAVRTALEGPISTACPASIVRRHPNARVFLDPDSAALLSLPADQPA